MTTWVERAGPVQYCGREVPWMLLLGIVKLDPHGKDIRPYTIRIVRY